MYYTYRQGSGCEMPSRAALNACNETTRGRQTGLPGAGIIFSYKCRQISLKLNIESCTSYKSYNCNDDWKNQQILKSRNCTRILVRLATLASGYWLLHGLEAALYIAKLRTAHPVSAMKKLFGKQKAWGMLLIFYEFNNRVWHKNSYTILADFQLIDHRR